MKKCIIFILLVSILCPGCALFELPGMILQQVVPMVIQYAPYALMFIEETNEKTVAQNLLHIKDKRLEVTKANDLEKFYRDLHNNIQKSSTNLNELSFNLRENLAQKNIKSVYVVNIHDISQEQLTHFFTKLSKQGKIHYYFMTTNPIECEEKIAQLYLPRSIPVHTTQIASTNFLNEN